MFFRLISSFKHSLLRCCYFPGYNNGKCKRI